MITVEGAALIAQVFPIGLLIIVFEIRQISDRNPFPGILGRVWRYVVIYGSALTLTVVAMCVYAVAVDDRLVCLGY